MALQTGTSSALPSALLTSQNDKTRAESASHSGRTSTPPPPASERGRLELKSNVEMDATGRIRRPLAGDALQATGLDPTAVDSALMRELQRPHRESTPSASPHRKRQRINGDR
jgi:cell division cycle 20-like protein 1 (cofactor of APC complex)